ncbi:MAG: hypothetical protein JO279_15475 [Verrucomicrobia bacterium]|nr:hypothetical protein [Verrucomicrobiota bacterium]
MPGKKKKDASRPVGTVEQGFPRCVILLPKAENENDDEDADEGGSPRLRIVLVLVVVCDFDQRYAVPCSSVSVASESKTEFILSALAESLTMFNLWD